MSAERFIGVLSGTSLDALDLALVHINKSGTISQLDALNWKLPESLQQQCHELCTPGANELVRYGIADRLFAETVAEGVHTLLAKNKLTAADIRAIGSHGQTVRHHPDANPAFTLQLGCPHTISALTGIAVVGQFRQKDIALGGEGAPLAPALHQKIFQVAEEQRIIANIGGIANITYLPASESEPVIGFDTGPGNTLMDYWVQKHLQHDYDANGDWAASGISDQSLLALMQSDPYFQKLPPKSTGREYFTPAWLQQALQQHAEAGATPTAPENIQATLLELTAITLTDAINAIPNPNSVPKRSVYVCGGGAHNQALTERCRTLLPNVSWQTTEAIGVHPDWVEAVLFAWLAWAHVHGVAPDLTKVTGAKRASVLGAYIPAS